MQHGGRERSPKVGKICGGREHSSMWLQHRAQGQKDACIWASEKFGHARFLSCFVQTFWRKAERKQGVRSLLQIRDTATWSLYLSVFNQFIRFKEISKTKFISKLPSINLPRPLQVDHC